MAVCAAEAPSAHQCLEHLRRTSVRTGFTPSLWHPTWSHSFVRVPFTLTLHTPFPLDLLVQNTWPLCWCNQYFAIVLIIITWTLYISTHPYFLIIFMLRYCSTPSRQFQPPSACHTHITQTWQEENNVIDVTRQKRRKKLELGEKACWCLVSAENLQLSAWIFLFCWYLMPLEWDSIINYLCGAFKNSMDKSYSLYL